MTQSRVGAFITSVVTAIVCVVLLMPTVAVVPLSITKTDFVVFPPRGFSMRWYEAFFTSDVWRGAVMTSFITAILTMLVATPIGTMMALGIARLKGRWVGTANVFILLPIIVPTIVTAVALYGLLAKLGLVGTIPGLVLAHTVLALPFVVINVAAVLQKFDRRTEQAARSLGASPFTAFRRVTLPAILPGIAAGALFAFLTSFDDFVIALFLAGVDAVTLPVQMWSGIRFEISPVVASASTVLLMMSCLLLLLQWWVKRR
jgi:ABC-type spermidine/putrescine transport system permease subunit II